MTDPILLEARDIKRSFPAQGGRRLRAVDGVDLAVHDGEVLGVVGESGSGKSTLARLLLRLLEVDEGSITFQGADLATSSRAALRRRRRAMQMVFQDPIASLNPRMSVGRNIAEPLVYHGIGDQRARLAAARAILDDVGLPAGYFDRFPHQLSGGENQRVCIARALILKPRLLVLDEPVSALDVSIQATILSLLQAIRRAHRLTYIFISHDLNVVRRICDRAAVLYLGRVVEIGPVDALYQRPLHPYTAALIQAAPLPDPTAMRVADLALIPGEIPSALNPPAGCHFHPRCPQVMPVCRHTAPALVETGAKGQSVACFLHSAATRQAAPGCERS